PLHRRPPAHPLFPYTTLFRSDAVLPVRRQLAPAHAALELGRAVHLVRVRLVGAAVADHGLAAHERRPVALLARLAERRLDGRAVDRKSTRLNSSHVAISYAVF